MRTLTTALAVLALTVAAQALPTSGGMGMSPYATNQGPGYAQDFRKAQALRALRAQGLKMQEADGGALTVAHRAALQQKLDHILVGNY
jgi:hypothetical protein